MTTVTVTIKISTDEKFDGVSSLKVEIPENRLPRLYNDNFANALHGAVLIALDHYDEENRTGFGEIGVRKYGI